MTTYRQRPNTNRYGLQHVDNHTGPVITRLASRIAGLIDALQTGQSIARIHAKLIESAQRQGFVDAARKLTPAGKAWRAAHDYELTPAPYEAICGRKRVGDTPAQKAAFRQYRMGRREALAARVFEYLGRGDHLFLVHERVFKVLGQEEIVLWLYVNLHPGGTLESAAKALHWTLSDTEIRAERILAKEHALPLKQEDAA